MQDGLRVRVSLAVILNLIQDLVPAEEMLNRVQHDKYHLTPIFRRGSAVNKIVLVVVLICICAMPAHAVSYVIQDLGTLGGADSYAYGVNQLGQVVGVSDAADGTQHAFLWQNGVMTHLGAGYACGINDSGQVALTAMTSDGYYHAFIWQNGAVTDLGIGAAQAINNEGQVVGNTIASDGSEHAFLYSNGAMTDLGTLTGFPNSNAVAINNAGQVIGNAISADGNSGTNVIWQGGAVSEIPGLPNGASVLGISDAGQIVGVGFTPPGPDGTYCEQAFVWQDNVTAFLGSLREASLSWPISSALGIDNKGQVVGSSMTSQPIVNSVAQSDGFVWQNGVMTDLGTLGGQDSIAYAINDNGWIVGGSGTADGSGDACLWVPAPEPGSLVALLAGVFGLVVRRRNNRPTKVRG